MRKVQTKKPATEGSTVGIVKIGHKQREVRGDGYVILVSYTTPVAYTYEGNLFITTEKYSPTTTRQINRWRTGRGGAQEVSEKELGALMSRLTGRSRLDPM